MMNKSLVVIALLGLLVSGYLFISYVSAGPITCSFGGGCDVVRASSYASVIGLPTPFYGIIYYFVLGLLASLILKKHSWTLVFLTGTGFAVSVGLTYVEIFIIEALCMWCVISAILATSAFYLVWFKK